MPEDCGITSDSRRSNRKELVSRLASKQWGRISFSQLKTIGVGDATVKRWRRDGYLHRVLPGVYAVGHTAHSVEADLSAALLYAGPGAMLSHATATWWWGLLDKQPTPIEVTIPTERRSRRAIKVHGRRDLPRVWHRRLPVTTVEDTLLDYAIAAPLTRLRHALAEAEYRGLLHIDRIDEVLTRGRRGAAKLRTALARHRPELAVTRSELERAFLTLCEDAAVPMPNINYRHSRMTVDAIWEAQRLVVELDGYRGHRTRAQIDRDRRRELHLRAAGYTVVRYIWSQVIYERELVVADLRALLADHITDGKPRHAGGRPRISPPAHQP